MSGAPARSADRETTANPQQQASADTTVASTNPTPPPIGAATLKTAPIPNPLHQYASYTYNWSLWWLDLIDYNRLSSGLENGQIDSPLSEGSYVIAEDSGLYPDRRLPTQAGLIFHIQSVNIETLIGLNTISKSSNLVEGSMTII